MSFLINMKFVKYFPSERLKLHINYFVESVNLTWLSDHVTDYESFVIDGHTNYYGKDGYRATVPAKYELLNIARQCNDEQFKADLKDHEHGKDNYLAFIKINAYLGITKWEVCMQKMACTYYDKEGNEVLAEEIPQ